VSEIVRLCNVFPNLLLTTISLYYFEFPFIISIFFVFMQPHFIAFTFILDLFLCINDLRKLTLLSQRSL
jgi:hypothetical protein